MKRIKSHIFWGAAPVPGSLNSKGVTDKDAWRKALKPGNRRLGRKAIPADGTPAFAVLAFDCSPVIS